MAQAPFSPVLEIREIFHHLEALFKYNAKYNRLSQGELICQCCREQLNQKRSGPTVPVKVHSAHFKEVLLCRQ